MLYSTIVPRDQTGFNQIYDAAREFEELNALEAIIACKFDKKKVEQTLNLVRMYQLRLNNESMELVAFSENFIEEYATDHNECFRLTEKLVRRIGTTITGSMKIFRKFCPVVRRKLDGAGNIVPTLDYSRLTFRQFQGQLFGIEVYIDLVQTLLHELAAFFYQLVLVLKVCKDMIRQEEEVLGDYERLKKIFEKSCDEVLRCVNDVFDTFGEVKLISEEELAERRKNARPIQISEGEILDSIERPLGATTLDGVKRRVRAGMGRCQAGFCSPKVIDMLAEKQGISYGGVKKNG